MAINDPVNNDESMQYLCPPSMNDSTYDAYFEREEYEQDEVDDHITGALKECLEEIDVKAKELLKRIFSKGDTTEIPLGKLVRDAIGESRAKDFLGKMLTKVINKMEAQEDEDFAVADRGVGIDEELGQKLERFKVKTVNIGGMVDKDDKK